MNEFDLILEECVDLIASGETSPEECLAQYPEYAAQLEPILYTAYRLREAREVAPPPYLRSRIRAELKYELKNNPHPKPRVPILFWHKALGAALLVIAFVMTNTYIAQAALPGQTLYNWKLASERLWRAMTADPLETDLKLSDRRIHEYVAVSSDEQRRAEVLLGYNRLLVRFKAEEDEQDRARILRVLKSQQDSLRKVGLSIAELDGYFSGAAQAGTP